MKYIFLLIALFAISTGSYSQLTEVQYTMLYPSLDVVSRYHNDWTQKHYKNRIKDFKNDTLNFGDIVFIGNSITEQGRDWSVKFGIKNIRNRGIAGDVTDGVIKRLNEIIYFKPKAVFILIGINDLFNLHHNEDNRHNLKYDKIVPSPKYVAQNILKISRMIHRKCPDTKIFVRTLLPTTREYLKADIVIVNSYIKQFEKKGYFSVIDLYPLFSNDNSEMDKELTKDGVHLNEKGYVRWVEAEKRIIEAL
ncbi:MAG: hypothetical protein JW717_09080 [Marinilabiliaceae bacterium]|nr:hypothetical protein [Marinilabiliaceae bacterium]